MMKIKETPSGTPQYFARIGDEIRGPYDLDGLETLALIGVIAPDTPVVLEGTTDFKPVTEWPFYKQLFKRKYWGLSKFIPRTVIAGKRAVSPTSPLKLAKKDLVPVSAEKQSVTPDGLTAPPTATMRRIASKEELCERTTANPSDPIVVNSLNYIQAEMLRMGRSKEKVLEHYFEENRKFNRLQMKAQARQDRPDASTGSVKQIKDAAIASAITLNILCALIMYFWPGSRHSGPSAIIFVNLCCWSCWGFAAVIEHWLRTHFYASLLAEMIIIFLSLVFLGTIVGSVFTIDPNFDPFTWLITNTAAAARSRDAMTVFETLTAKQALIATCLYVILSLGLAFFLARALPGIRKAWFVGFLALSWLLLGPVWSYRVKHLLSLETELWNWSFQPQPELTHPFKIGDGVHEAPGTEGKTYGMLRETPALRDRALQLASIFLKPEAYVLYAQGRYYQPKFLNELTAADVAALPHISHYQMLATVLGTFEWMDQEQNYSSILHLDAPKSWLQDHSPTVLQAELDFISLWTPALHERCQKTVERWLQANAETLPQKPGTAPALDTKGAKVVLLRAIGSTQLYQVTTAKGEIYQVAAPSPDEALRLLANQ
jgi:hypothetical protein